MKELEVGDKVWVECVVTEAESPFGDDRQRISVVYGPVAFRAMLKDCRPVESGPAKEPTEAQKLAERTMKAIGAANDAVNERPPSVEPPPGLRWSPGDRVRIDADGGPFMRDTGIIKVVKPTYCDVVLDRNGQTYSFDTNRLEPESNEEDPFFVTEAEIKVEGEDTPSTTTSKDYYGPDISKVTFQFTQTPNTLGTTDPTGEVGSEDITIDCEYQLPGEEPFFVIQSYSGWSFDDPESFLKLLLSVKEAEEKCRCSLPQS
jgi:hypothetical protein